MSSWLTRKLAWFSAKRIVKRIRTVKITLGSIRDIKVAFDNNDPTIANVEDGAYLAVLEDGNVEIRDADSDDNEFAVAGVTGDQLIDTYFDSIPKIEATVEYFDSLGIDVQWSTSKDIDSADE